MPVKIILPDHIELIGRGYVLLTATHAAGPDANLHMGQIVEDAALISRAYAVIGKISREYIDPNRIEAARTEFRKAIDSLLAEEGIRCILDIHGKMEPGVEIGTAKGKTGSMAIASLVETRLSKNFAVKLDQKYESERPGSIIITYGGKGSNEEFLVEAVQVAFGAEERQAGREKVITELAELVGLINVKLGFVEETEPSVGAD